MGDFNVDDLLGRIMSEMAGHRRETLTSLFEKRLAELDINQTTAAEIMGIQHRGLVGILNGTLKRVDFSTLVKLSSFLQRPETEILELFMDNFRSQMSSNTTQDKVAFIRNNFDLATLKKVGLINDIADFNEIEAKLCELFRLDDILDYRPSQKVPAFSAGKIKKEKSFSQSNWLTKAEDLLNQLENPHPYDREKLIEIFPSLRWYSTQVKIGLQTVISILYKCGINVIYVPSFPNLHVRGATISMEGRPSVILTDYKGFYGTIWFALIHELYHVLFDWDEISQGSYHLSFENTSDAPLPQKEIEANDFARKYLFSKEKSATIRRHLNNHKEVSKYAAFNDVHPSLVYLFEAYDAGSKALNWMRARKYNESVADCLGELNSTWSHITSLNQYVSRNRIIYS